MSRLFPSLAARAINRDLIGLYCDIGRMIVERQEKQGRGKSVVERLSMDLRIAESLQTLPGISEGTLQKLKRSLKARVRWVL